MPNKAPSTALAAAKIHAKKGSSQVQLAEIAAGTRTQKVDLQRESILARLRVARAQYAAAAAQVDAVIQALQGGGTRYDTSQPHEAAATTKQEERNPMSWHTILEDAADVTVADVGHHPFTSAAIFYELLGKNDFRAFMNGSTGEEIEATLSAVIDHIDAEPETYKALEGQNGSLDGARAYLVSLRIACLANPTATVRVIGDQAATTTAPAAD